MLFFFFVFSTRLTRPRPGAYFGKFPVVPGIRAVVRNAPSSFLTTSAADRRRFPYGEAPRTDLHAETEFPKPWRRARALFSNVQPLCYANNVRRTASTGVDSCSSRALTRSCVRTSRVRCRIQSVTGKRLAPASNVRFRIFSRANVDGEDGPSIRFETNTSGKRGDGTTFTFFYVFAYFDIPPDVLRWYFLSVSVFTTKGIKTRFNHKLDWVSRVSRAVSVERRPCPS